MREARKLAQRAARLKLSMCCDIESRRSSADRKAAWHRDCAIPLQCQCPAHKSDGAG